jgi:hypothetical protein
MNFVDLATRTITEKAAPLPELRLESFSGRQ